MSINMFTSFHTTKSSMCSNIGKMYEAFNMPHKYSIIPRISHSKRYDKNVNFRQNSFLNLSLAEFSLNINYFAQKSIKRHENVNKFIELLYSQN